jgi:hypothetical protein
MQKPRTMARLFRFESQDSALAGFEPALGFVNHIDASLAADHAAIAVAQLQGAKRIANLHGLSPSCGARTGPAPCFNVPFGKNRVISR